MAVLVKAVVALGSNLGDRRASLLEALRLVAELPGTRLLRASDLIETEAVDSPPGAGKFLNGAALLETSLSARELLEHLLKVEQRIGRERTQRNAPRTIDLDLLLFGDSVIDEPGLIVPHPRMNDRRFVLWPLLQIAPKAIDPRSGKPFAEALAKLAEE